MNCEICDNRLKDNIIYENDELIIMLAPNPCTSGHIQIFPRNHHTILEQLTVEDIQTLSVASNKVSMLLFESLKVHGTNILIQNGVSAGQTIPHFSIHIIPRRSDDGLKLDWDMKQGSAESLDSIHRIIQEGITLDDNQEPAPSNVPEFIMTQDNKTRNNNIDASEASTEEKSEETPKTSEKKTNYFVKSLERIP